jgi:hypothetical protein
MQDLGYELPRITIPRCSRIGLLDRLKTQTFGAQKVPEPLRTLALSITPELAQLPVNSWRLLLLSLPPPQLLDLPFQFVYLFFHADTTQLFDLPAQCRRTKIGRGCRRSKRGGIGGAPVAPPVSSAASWVLAEVPATATAASSAGAGLLPCVALG